MKRRHPTVEKKAKIANSYCDAANLQVVLGLWLLSSNPPEAVIPCVVLAWMFIVGAFVVDPGE